MLYHSLPEKFLSQRRLENLVENRTTYTVNNAELNIYETHHYAEEVILQFHQPVFASMIVGKKIMHLHESDPFEFLPGESLVMPAGEIMKIDFPEARLKNPTKCLAMTISPEKIKRIVSDMNQFHPKEDVTEWKMTDINFAFTNDGVINQIIQRLINLFVENHPSKDLFVDMALRELIIRVIQTENRAKYLNESKANQTTNPKIIAAIKYIRQHLSNPISIKDLSDHVYMSESNFFRTFKNEIGFSPTHFINLERIKLAKQLLADPNIQVKEIFAACGFNNISYFQRAFKKHSGTTPGEYRNSMNGSTKEIVA